MTEVQALRGEASTCQRWWRPMPPESPLPRLREIRDLQKSALELTPERDRLIRLAAELGHTQGELAVAAGLDQSVISRIVMRRA